MSSLTLSGGNFHKTILLSGKAFRLGRDLHVSISKIILHNDSERRAMLLGGKISEKTLLCVRKQGSLTIASALSILASCIPMGAYAFRMAGGMRLISKRQIQVIHPSAGR